MSLREDTISILRAAGEKDLDDATLERHFSPEELPTTLAQIKHMRKHGKITPEDLS